MPGFDIIYRQLWDSPSFRALPEDARSLFLYLLTCKHRNSFGCFVLPDGYTAADLQWPLARVRDAWPPLVKSEMVKRDEDNRLVLLTNALRFNHPANPSVQKQWASKLNALPHSPLIEDLRSLAIRYLEEWQRAWLTPSPTPCATPSPTPCATSQPQPQPQPLKEEEAPLPPKTPAGNFKAETERFKPPSPEIEGNEYVQELARLLLTIPLVAELASANGGWFQSGISRFVAAYQEMPGEIVIAEARKFTEFWLAKADEGKPISRPFAALSNWFAKVK